MKSSSVKTLTQKNKIIICIITITVFLIWLIPSVYVLTESFTSLSENILSTEDGFAQLVIFLSTPGLMLFSVIYFAVAFLIKTIICSSSALVVKRFLTTDLKDDKNKTVLLSVISSILFYLTVFVAITEQDIIQEFFLNGNFLS